MNSHERLDVSFDRPSRGVAAYILVLAFVGVLLVLVIMLSSTSISGKFLTRRYSDDEKASQLAEAASHLAFRLVAEEVNDPKVMYDLLRFQFKKENIDSWFWKFRFPVLTANAGIDKNSSINSEASEEGALGCELSLDTGSLFRDKTYTNVELVDLNPLIRELGGTASISVKAEIVKTYGILPKSTTYEVPGITIDTSKAVKGPQDWLGNFVNTLMSKVEFKLDFTGLILNAIPDKNLGDVIGAMVEGAKINVSIAAGIAFEVPVGKIIKPALESLITSLAGDDLSLKGLVQKFVIDELAKKNIKLEIDLTKYKNLLSGVIKDLLPDFLLEISGEIGWGRTMEKIGIFQVRAVVDYQPRGPGGQTLRRTLRTQKDFRVADIQPVAPDYSFFLANSPLLIEDQKIENKSGWQGGDQIAWAAGCGALVIHNLTLFDEVLIKRLADFLDALVGWKTEKLNNSLYLPGLVRINGTATQEIPLNFGLLNSGSFMERLKHCEIPSLLVCDDKNRHYDLKAGKYPTKTGVEGTDYIWDYQKHNIMPALGESIYGTGFEAPPPLSCLSPLAPVPHFDWPWVADSLIWIPLPVNYNSTHLFGDFHIEFPLKLRVEGNVWKKFSRLTLPMIRIYIPLSLVGGVDIDVTLFPIPFNKVIYEPYGYCTYPPLEKSEGGQADVAAMAAEWSHTDYKNLPDNLYSPTQYLKKASYFYRSSAEFNADIENRSTYITVDGVEKKVFVCDGVSFVEGANGGGLFLREMDVMGRGIIVCAGNIHIGGNIRRIDKPDGPLTMLTLVARNGAIINKGDNSVEACCYGDRGLMNTAFGKLRIFGNLVVNRFNRSDCQGDVDVHYESNRCHSSFISYFKDIAKYDITRYHVNISKKWREFQYEKN